MTRILALALALACSAAAFQGQEPAIQSRIEQASETERILVQEVLIDAPLEKVWEAYTTTEGWLAWVAPVAEVDLRVGGLIRSHYTAGASLGDEGTIELRIVNYVPQKLITLQVTQTPGDEGPSSLIDLGKNTSVTLFEALGPRRCRLTSYGIGYTNDPAQDELLGFFIQANEQVFAALKAYVEAGEEGRK